MNVTPGNKRDNTLSIKRSEFIICLFPLEVHITMSIDQERRLASLFIGDNCRSFHFARNTFIFTSLHVLLNLHTCDDF